MEMSLNALDFQMGESSFLVSCLLLLVFMLHLVYFYYYSYWHGAQLKPSYTNWIFHILIVTYPSAFQYWKNDLDEILFIWIDDGSVFFQIFLYYCKLSFVEYMLRTITLKVGSWKCRTPLENSFILSLFILPLCFFKQFILKIFKFVNEFCVDFSFYSPFCDYMHEFIISW